ncbi:hypothetical protein M426DRAFT_316121 [Hypoxylon sp. CI-4A]|nr:hypothetical protein M426DRAFT_316121 [Hypoxylon sp. CI-4A]
MSKGNKKSPSAAERLGPILLILSKLPMAIKVALLHVLGRSETSKHLDLKSNLTVSLLRSVFQDKPKSISKSQAMTLRDPGIKGRIWVSTAASQVPPEQEIRDALLAVIEALGDPKERGSAPTFRIPEIVSVEAEWTGYRAGATKDSTLPAVSEEEKYRELMKEVKNATTFLYFHGGAYGWCDPCTYRPLVKKLAKLSGGRAYSVRYRLAPQHPFPSALLDALVSYFSLLYPPPGSFHEPVSPKHIVLSGDSAGGNLALALLQTLLELRRQNRKIAWFGEEREVPLPAGLAGISPWVDVAQTMPSLIRNQKWDYLPAPRLLDEDHQPPADDIWPTTPRRRHVYIDDRYLVHPLACLQLAASWKGAPPVYVSCGWECLEDEDKYLAARLRRDGVTVMFEEYQAMPHVFAGVLSTLPESHRNLQGITRFAKAACDDAVQSSWRMIKTKTLEEVAIDPDALSSFTDEEVRELARRKAAEQQQEPLAPPSEASISARL